MTPCIWVDRYHVGATRRLHPQDWNLFSLTFSIPHARFLNLVLLWTVFNSVSTQPPFLACFPYFEKNKSRLMRSPCVCVYHPPINFWMPEPVFMKLGMYIMAREPILTAYFINASHQSVCLYMCIPLSLLGNGSVKTLPRQRIHNRKIVARVVFCAVCVVPKEISRLILPELLVSTLTMEAAGYCETVIPVYQFTRRHIP
jgi:hypothetical protein